MTRLRRGGLRGGRFAAFVYSFRTYSLLLLGALLIAAGIRLLRLSASLSTGASSRGPALRAVLAVLALVAPLIPIHGFRSAKPDVAVAATSG